MIVLDASSLDSIPVHDAKRYAHLIDHTELRTWREVMDEAVKQNRHRDFVLEEDFFKWVSAETLRQNEFIAKQLSRTLED